MSGRPTAGWSVAASLALWAAAAHAQSVTSVGVAAFVRGDYATAVEVLQPITDRWPGPVDDQASFFMASMYANGLGVAPDPVRACALFLRGHLAGGNTPFGRLNQALFGELQARLGPTGQGECVLLATLGFHHGFEPVTITLGPGHWIKLALSGEVQNVVADIVSAGKERRVEVGLNLSPGTIFLPVEHTELQASGTRHFLQFLQWMPAGTASWQLEWQIFEIVDDRLEHITGDLLYAADGPQPPRAPDFDVHRFVTLGVNQYGHAEWTVRPQGREARTESIETEVERQEMRAAAAARKAEEERDRSYRRGPGIPPAFAYTLTEGCGDIFADALSNDRTEVITVRVDRRQLGLDDRPWAFDLAATVPGVEVAIHLFEVPRTLDSFCSDARSIDGSREEIWRAIGGSMTIQLGPAGVHARAPWERRATIEILGAEFVGPSGQRVRATRPITITATVGRIFG